LTQINFVNVRHNFLFRSVPQHGIATAFDHCYSQDRATFAGSACDYLADGDADDTDELYALKVVRHCSEIPYCPEVAIAGYGEGTELDDKMLVGSLKRRPMSIVPPSGLPWKTYSRSNGYVVSGNSKDSFKVSSSSWIIMSSVPSPSIT